MNAGATAERVHAALRQRIMDRSFRPGTRLDVGVLADLLSASATPVREALHELSGEGLVETRTGGGFFLPAWDEPMLRDLYEWESEVLALAIRRWTDPGAAQAAATDAGSIADRTDTLFAAIARRSVNGEHASAVGRINSRLHAVRLVEPRVIDGIETEVAALAAAFGASEAPTLRRLCSGYHRRRQRAAAAIVRMAHRDD